MKNDKVKTYYIYACVLTCAEQCNNKEYLLNTGELVRGCGGRRKKVKNTESEKYIGEGVFHKMVNQ
jgi:hypothetical protein